MKTCPLILSSSQWIPISQEWPTPILSKQILILTLHPQERLQVLMKWSPKERCFDPSQVLSIIASRNNIVRSVWRICIWILGLEGLYFHWRKTPVLHAFSFSSLPTSYCNLSEKSCSFNRPFHIMIVNTVVANKSYSKVFAIRGLGPCGSLTLTELIC